MIKLKSILKEIGEGVTPYTWSGPDERSGMVVYYFTTEDGDQYKVKFDGMFDNDWELAFYSPSHTSNDGEYFGAVINKGRQFKVISTIMDIIKSFVNEYPVDMIVFSGSDKKGSKTNQRDLLYKKYLTKNIKYLPGYHADLSSSYLKIIRDTKLPSMTIK